MASERKESEGDLLQQVLDAEKEATGKGADRRQFERVSSLLGALLEVVPLNARDLGTFLLDLDGNITIDLLPKGQASRVIIVDISAGGLKGASSVPVPDLGRTVVIRIFSEKSPEPIPILAEVAWKRAMPLQDMTAFGLQFVGVHPKDRQRIEDIVEQG